MNPERGGRPAEDELVEAVTRRPGAVLLVGAWASKTILAVAHHSPDVSVIALTERDATRIRDLAAAERLPVRVYLPSAVLDPLADRDPQTGTVRWTHDLLGPVPAWSRVAVAGFSDEGLAAALGAELTPDVIVVVAGGAADLDLEPMTSSGSSDPVLDALEAIVRASTRS